ncbi:DUF4349 domain-containing protein [Parvicella tangerina]|uniref:DUF4349 domain-containing protein n=1 Tax=Parvicella tangerina TaxID=2829795 RepID=A0A916NCL7_9FLAO|nr:DUF4349 domain-containing protein [Parvicella tangerina]CAG5085504.1 hypothetical protein CRYO30217_02777 [Parvicella tangerina]
MKNSIKTLSFIILFGISSCGAAENESYSEDYKAEEGSSAPYTESSAAQLSYEEEPTESAKKDEGTSENHRVAITSVAASGINDSTLRFIRTAQLKYKTKSVRKTTYLLENAIVHLGGIVTYTNLYSDIENVKKVAISKDSSLKVTTYQVKNNMTIRIPNTQLDSLLKVISTTVTFLDKRIVSADEISLTELKNQLEQNRMANYQEQLKNAIQNKEGKINNVVDAYESMLHKQKLKDDAFIRNLELDYDVEYSVVELSIYQDTSTDKELVENELNIEEFEPSFSSKLGESLKNGWNMILAFIVAIANLWFLIIPLILVGIYFLRKRKVQKNT